MDTLQTIAEDLLLPGKGLLAADESFSTVEKRFSSINLESNEETRRAYRELFLHTYELEKYISGVILFDETIRQTWHKEGNQSFVALLQEENVIPGIKVDGGTEDIDGNPNEKLTKGLDGLSERLAEYKSLGAEFTKWRAAIGIATSDSTIEENADRMAQYAKLVQDRGMVPIVEPEVLMDGSHDLKAAEAKTYEVLKRFFSQLSKHDVDFTGLILKSSMVVSGKDAENRANPDEVAKATLRVFEEVLPHELPGIVFLSGGQTSLEATENLQAICKLAYDKQVSWKLTFSFARALQEDALLTWQGKQENVERARKVFLHRCRMNSQASLGEYTTNMEMENELNS